MERRNASEGRVRTAGADRGLLWLLGVNGLLLGLLGLVTFGPAAEAQVRVRGEYTMTAGGAKGANGGVVYIVDTANQELIAMTYDTSTKEIIGIGYRNMAADVESMTTSVRPR